MSRFCSRGARLQKASSHRVVHVAMQNGALDRLHAACFLKWSGRLSHRARWSWSVSFPAKLKHLWEKYYWFLIHWKLLVLLLLIFFLLLSKFTICIKIMRCERDRLLVHSKRYSFGKKNVEASFFAQCIFWIAQWNETLFTLSYCSYSAACRNLDCFQKR